MKANDIPPQSKYSPAELKQMAIQTLAARDGGDVRFLQMMLILSARSGIEINECVRLIEEMAA